MWDGRFFALAFVVATTAANREADRVFFGNDSSQSTPSYIPAIPMEGRVRVRSFFDRLYTTTKNTKFRFSFNPGRCDSQLEHKVVLGFLDDWLPEQTLTVDMLQNRMLLKGRPLERLPDEVFWHQNFGYNSMRFVDGNQYPNNLSNLYVALTMNEAHFYVEVTQYIIQLYLFEENSHDVKFYQTIRTSKQQARYFVLMANQYNSCPTFISVVDHQFPYWVQGMPITTAKGTPPPKVNLLPQWFGVFDVVLWATLVVIVYCVLVSMVAIPLYLNRFYPIGTTAQTAEVQVLNYGIRTELQQPPNEDTARSGARNVKKTRSLDKASKSLKKKRNLKNEKSSKELLLKTQDSESLKKAPKKKDMSEEPTQHDHL